LTLSRRWDGTAKNPAILRTKCPSSHLCRFWKGDNKAYQSTPFVQSYNHLKILCNATEKADFQPLGKRSTYLLINFPASTSVREMPSSLKDVIISALSIRPAQMKTKAVKTVFAHISQFKFRVFNCTTFVKRTILVPVQFREHQLQPFLVSHHIMDELG
jgi:hypothetical protein